MAMNWRLSDLYSVRSNGYCFLNASISIPAFMAISINAFSVADPLKTYCRYAHFHLGLVTQDADLDKSQNLVILEAIERRFVSEKTAVLCLYPHTGVDL